MATLAAFYETRDMFRNYYKYIEPLTFEEWSALSDDDKLTVLFLQYFPEITLAWDKANVFDFIEGEEGVSTTLQYLQKQICDCYIKGHPKKKVSKEYFNAHPDECEERRVIEENPKKFSAAYIYKVCYNSLYCICHDLKSVKDRWENETSSIVTYGEDELSLFDIIEDKHGSIFDVVDAKDFEEEFWAIIEDTGVSAEKIMRYLLSGNKADLKKVNASSESYKLDPLRDVEVSKETLISVLDHLRKKFLSLSASSPCRSYISTFEALASA